MRMRNEFYSEYCCYSEYRIAVAEDIVQRARCGEQDAQAHLYEVLAPAHQG